MKSQFNMPLNVGDRIMVYHMEGELSVPAGTTGTVKKIGRDPFEPEGESIIEVNWDNGSNLSLLSSTDVWKIIEDESQKLNEQGTDQNWQFITQNADVFENFDWRWFREFLSKIRDSGIINMFGAAPLLYSGKKHIERYYGEDREDDDVFQAVLEDAENSKNKIVQGVLKYMEKNDKDLDNMDLINRYARHFSQKLLGLYITFSNITDSRF
jgi:hypothetical protein